MHSCGGSLAESLFWRSKGRAEAGNAASESRTCTGGSCTSLCFCNLQGFVTCPRVAVVVVVVFLFSALIGETMAVLSLGGLNVPQC